MKINCLVDAKGYKLKPNNEMGKINNRIIKQINKCISINELAQCISEGKTYLIGSLIDNSKGRKKDNINNINAFSLDVDNHYYNGDEDVYTNYSISEVTSLIYQITGAKPLISYTTFTGINKINNSKRFRLIYGLEKSINSKELELLIQTIIDKTNNIFDKACKDSARLFLGTNKPLEVALYKDYIKVSESTIKSLIEHQENKKAYIQKCKEIKKINNNTTYQNNIIDALKNIDIIDFINRTGSYKTYDKGDKILFNPCPICGHKDDFYVFKNTNSFNCFGSNGNKGGSIIDLYMAVYRTSLSDAITNLCDLYNIKPINNENNFNSKALNEYTIDKYIGKDKNATQGILRAIQDNNKTLLVAPMGSGKTHFLRFDLFEYAQNNNKKVIIVIPNIKQLKSMENNYLLDVVYGGYPYQGSDIVATTPESLYKITSTLADGEYILCIDEAHEIITSYDLRNGYKGTNIENAENRAFKVLHITATPRPLLNQKYDTVININSNSKIKNKIEILQVANNDADTMAAILKDAIANKFAPLFYNNNKEENEFLKQALDIQTELETLTLKSGDNTTLSNDINIGVIPKDKPIMFTSTIKAGIDLISNDNNVLIINATEHFAIDDIIQLIGRFRNGIKVLLIVKAQEENNFYDWNSCYNSMISDYESTYKRALNNPIVKELDGDYMDGNCLYIDQENNIKLDYNRATSYLYGKWNSRLKGKTEQIINLLHQCQAFEVIGHIGVTQFQSDLEGTINDAIKLSKKEKKELEVKALEVLKNTDKNTLSMVIDGFALDGDIEIIQAYKTIKASNKHVNHLVKIEKAYSINRLESLIKYTHIDWNTLKADIKQLEVIKRNKDIKEFGTDYISQEDKTEYKLQAKIIKELGNVVHKKFSNKMLKQLTLTLIQGNYIKSKYVTVFQDEKMDYEIRNKAFNKLTDRINDMVKLMYNFKGNTTIFSSLKTKENCTFSSNKKVQLSA